jgi:hypothetical protein
MGLLDDAIREHLELKRRRGADPAEVARAQRDALDPARDRAARSEPGDAAQSESLEEGPLPPAETLASVGSGDTDNMEETAELDMNAVLEHEPSPKPASHAEEDSLERGVPEQIDSQSGAERREVRDPAEQRAGTHGNQEEHGIVAEIPEQERLQFEQGAPGHADSDR